MPADELETLRTLARLSRLELSPEEERTLAGELARILAAFEALARRPSGATPAGAPPAPGRTRGDVPQPSLARDVLLAAAPEALDGFLRVPKTVGNER